MMAIHPTPRAPCADCGKDTEPCTKVGRPLFKQWDSYVIRGEVWREAGMDSGFLCTPCLVMRLGRDLAADDYLVRTIGTTGRALEMLANPDYAERQLRGEESETFGLEPWDLSDGVRLSVLQEDLPVP